MTDSVMSLPRNPATVAKDKGRRQADCFNNLCCKEETWQEHRTLASSCLLGIEGQANVTEDIPL